MGRNYRQSKVETLLATRNLFWRQGYSQTSIKDIEQATGLRPGSIYHQFEDKQTLFEQSLDQYIDTVIRPRTDEYLFSTQGDARANILGFFDAVLKISVKSRHGCMAVNSAIEAPYLDNIHSKLDAMIDLLETGFLFQLNRIEESKTNQHWNKPQMARQLVLLNQGFWSMVRINGSNQNVKQYLAAIDELIC